MGASGNDNHQSTVLHERALDKISKFMVDHDVLFKLYKKAAGQLKKALDKGKAGYVLDFHKVHMQYLIMVYTAVVKMEETADAVSQLERNMDAYVASAEKELQFAATISPDPLQKMTTSELYYNSSDPVFKRLYNDTVNTQRQLTKAVLDSLVECGDQGRLIKEDTKLKLEELKEKLEAMVPKSSAEQLIINRNKQNLGIVSLKLTKLDVITGRMAQAIAIAQQNDETANHYPIM
ncbi:hypothetical protein [Paenibacillus illinoisensis]|uniref:hypothetical protein n=1 Tax=Paenibacillus illinoisensis TaxID=59845 RepID=UPI0012B95AFA|nr:hypothetical protein [Paenibacillus xylanexedens]